MSKKKKHEIETIEDIELSLTKAEQFIERNQRLLLAVFIGIVAVVAGIWAYFRYLENENQAAMSQMFVAEQYFERDSFDLAIHGDGNYPGFLEIIDMYGSTKAGNLSHYYTGIAYLNLGDYESAIEHLQKFDSDDIVMSTLSSCAIGDAYVELEEYRKAIDYYLDAANKNENTFTTPIYLKKAALVYEELGNYEKALELYLEIKDQYPDTNEGRQAEKYISRVKTFVLNQ
jgi:tetratricopeptide (TPR) repeat protein